MSYLGNNPNKGSFFQQKLAGDGSTTSFTLLQSVTDGSQLLVTIGNVIQEEGNGKAYTASGATLTFDSAPANGDVIVVRYLGRSLDTPTTYATQITFKYVATNGQTAFTGSDANGITLSYTIGSVDVYLNGVHLDTTDFTETNESTITLASGATTSDEVVIVAKRTITLTDVVPKSAGGTFAGNVIAGGNLTVNGAFTSQGIDDNADATAITITSAELVGISETSPLGKLHIKSGDSGASSVNANANELVVENSDYTGMTILGENESNICFGDNEDPDVGRIEYHHSDNSMRFRTNASDKMRIDSSGNVGVGTSSPDVKLDVGNSDSGSAGFVGIQIQNSQDFSTVYNGSNVATFAGIQTVNHDDTSNRTGTGVVFVHRSSSSGIAAIQSTSNNSDRADLRFITRGAGGIGERVRIDNDGLVGIGTTSPANNLHVMGSMTLEGSSGTDNAWTFYKNTDQTYLVGIRGSSNDALAFYDLTADVERMRIDTSGRVGINQSSPLAKLDIKGDTTTFDGMAKIYLTDNNGNSNSRNWSIGNGGSAFGSLTFAVSASKDGNAGDNTATNAMVISNGGNVGINNTTPSANLDITANVNAGFIAEFHQAHSSGYGLQVAATGSNLIFFYKGGANIGNIVESGGGVNYGSNSDYRLKENIKYDFDATTELKKIKPCEFNFTGIENSTQNGFIAHELNEVVPMAVVGEKDAVDGNDEPIYQQVDASRIVPLLTKALQEQQATIEALTARIVTLENA